MRLHGQAQADLMWMRSLIHNAVSAVASRLSDLASSLAPVATSGDYADLANKPTLGALASQDAVTHSQVNDWETATNGFAKTADLGALASQDTVTHSQVSDWDTATSGFAQSSSLATVATTGAYADLSGKPTLGALASLSSVTTSLISDWSTATSGFAADSGVVHKAGAESVTGVKTFGAEIRTSRSGSATHIRFTNTGLTKGTAPSAQQNWYLPFSGSDGYNYGAIEIIARTNGEIVSRLYAFKNTAGSNATSAALGVVYPAATSPYATAPSTPVNSTGAQIVTADYLPKQGYVTADSTRLADIASHAGARLKNLAGTWGSAVQGIAYDAYDDVLYAIRNSSNGSYLIATRWSTNTRLAASPLFYAGWAHQGLALYRPTEDSPVLFFAGANKHTSSSASDASRLFRLNLNRWDYASPTTFTTEHYWTLFDATVYNTGRDAMDVAISEDGTKLLAYAQKLSDSTWVAAVWNVSDILAAADGTNIYSLATVYDLPWGTSNVGGQGTALDSRYAYFLYSNSGTNPHYIWALSLESGSAVLVRDPSYEGFEIYGVLHRE